MEVKPWSKWRERHNEKEGDVIRGNQRNLKNHGCEKKLDYVLNADQRGVSHRGRVDKRVEDRRWVS